MTKYKHDIGVKKLFPEIYGMSLVFIDDKSEAFVYNPISSILVKIAGFPSTIHGVVWENFEPEKVGRLIWSITLTTGLILHKLFSCFQSIFIAFNGENIHTYVFSKYSVNGPSCFLVGTMRQPYSSLPLILSKGLLIFLDTSGKIVQMKLDSHTHDTSIEGLQQNEVLHILCISFLD